MSPSTRLLTGHNIAAAGHVEKLAFLEARSRSFPPLLMQHGQSQICQPIPAGGNDSKSNHKIFVKIPKSNQIINSSCNFLMYFLAVTGPLYFEMFTVSSTVAVRGKCII
jgi:hypothetical protein